jgi:hypothetical protein
MCVPLLLTADIVPSFDWYRMLSTTFVARSPHETLRNLQIANKEDSELGMWSLTEIKEEEILVYIGREIVAIQQVR